MPWEYPQDIEYFNWPNLFSKKVYCDLSYSGLHMEHEASLFASVKTLRVWNEDHELLLERPMTKDTVARIIPIPVWILVMLGSLFLFAGSVGWVVICHRAKSIDHFVIKGPFWK